MRHPVLYVRPNRKWQQLFAVFLLPRTVFTYLESTDSLFRMQQQKANIRILFLRPAVIESCLAEFFHIPPSPFCRLGDAKTMSWRILSTAQTWLAFRFMRHTLETAVASAASTSSWRLPFLVELSR